MLTVEKLVRAKAQLLNTSVPEVSPEEAEFVRFANLVTDDALLASLYSGVAMFEGKPPSVHVVADRPDDIHHFCEALITGPGYRINTPPLSLEIRRDLNDAAALSETPHNALSDARALREFGKRLEANGLGIAGFGVTPIQPSLGGLRE